MKDMQIRVCRDKDINIVASLQRKWIKEDITYGYTMDDKIYLESKLGKYFIVAEKDGEIEGYAFGTVNKAKNMTIFDDQELYFEVEDLYITPECRALGLGSRLLDHLLKIEEDNGVKRSLIYSSTKELEPIIKFYKKHDYKTWSVQMYK